MLCNAAASSNTQLDVHATLVLDDTANNGHVHSELVGPVERAEHLASGPLLQSQKVTKIATTEEDRLIYTSVDKVADDRG